MRITGGEYRGRRLVAPRDPAVRLTTDRVKEAVFSILGGALEHDRVLDLYAGSGALGLEALSRGAESATFVEQGAAQTAVIGENVDLLGLDEKARILSTPVGRALETLAAEAARFSLIFLDPPYRINNEIVEDVLRKLISGSLIRAQGQVVLESSARVSLIRRVQGFEEPVVREYGDTRITFLRVLGEHGSFGVPGQF
ncbi:MAG: 16S rRNA (guanine(966)-N(2))-methyltransferase RsmD [Terriglobia bacterium]